MPHVIVGSKNPIKIKAVQDAFEAMFKDATFTFEGISVPSDVPDQPWEHEETLIGALNRARNCQTEKPTADYWVGLEGGLVTDPQGDVGTTAWSAVLSSNGLTGKGQSNWHQVPPKVIALVRQGYELGDADDIVFNLQNSKQANGATGILSDNAKTRGDALTEAVFSALMVHNKPELFTDSVLNQAA